MPVGTAVPASINWPRPKRAFSFDESPSGNLHPGDLRALAAGFRNC
jgi:hypothetical protein